MVRANVALVLKSNSIRTNVSSSRRINGTKKSLVINPRKVKIFYPAFQFSSLCTRPADMTSEPKLILSQISLGIVLRAL